jgi:hypothetical protein
VSGAISFQELKTQLDRSAVGDGNDMIDSRSGIKELIGDCEHGSPPPSFSDIFDTLEGLYFQIMPKYNREQLRAFVH